MLTKKKLIKVNSQFGFIRKCNFFSDIEGFLKFQFFSINTHLSNLTWKGNFSFSPEHTTLIHSIFQVESESLHCNWALLVYLNPFGVFLSSAILSAYYFVTYSPVFE